MTKNVLEYNGYCGSIDFDLSEKVLFGKVLLVEDTIIYQGKDLEELESSFRDAVDEYLETCEEIGKTPDKPFSGTFNVRIDPELHKCLAYKVEATGLKSLNYGVARAIQYWLKEEKMTNEVIHNHNVSIKISNVIENFPAVEFNEYRSEEHTSELQSRENLVCR